MEKLILIAVIVIASLIHSWMKRRQEQEQEQGPGEYGPDSGPPPGNVPGQPQAPRPRRAGSPGGWEEELRRLLQGDVPTAAPRPVVRAETPRPRPIPPPLPPPVPPRFGSGRPSAPPLARSSIPVPAEGMEMEVGLPVRPVTFNQATSAHARAIQMQANVAQRMHDTGTRITTHTGAVASVARAVISARVREMLRSQETQRAAILAAVILGPPRALERP